MKNIEKMCILLKNSNEPIILLMLSTILRNNSKTQISQLYNLF